MVFSTGYTEERLELESGYLIFIESEQGIFITEAHANDTDKVLALFAEAKETLSFLYYDRPITVLVAPDLQLLEIFMKKKGFELDYCAFKVTI